MTLKDYIKILKDNLLFIVVICALTTTVAFFSTNFLKSGYIDKRTLFLTITNQDGTKQNIIDTVNTTDTVVAILESPNLINKAPSNISIDAKKQAPQIIDLTVTSSDPKTSSEASAEIVNSFNSKINELVPSYNLRLAQINQEKAPTQRILNNKVLAAAGAVFGFALSIMLIAIARYFKV